MSELQSISGEGSPFDPIPHSRPNLADRIAEAICRSRWGEDGQDHSVTYWDRETAEAVLALVRPRIETQAELDALPFLSLVREIRNPAPSGVDYGGVYERRTSGWQCIAGAYTAPERNGEPTLPVRLLYTPQEVLND